jgi:hypothetical protein
MLDHVKKTLEGKEAKDVIAWFDYSRARKDDVKDADNLS